MAGPDARNRLRPPTSREPPSQGVGVTAGAAACGRGHDELDGGDDRGQLVVGRRRELRRHSGLLPCLRVGSSSRFERSSSKPAMSFAAGVGRIDHVVDEAPLGRAVRIGEPLGVLLDQLGLRARPGRRPICSSRR